MIARCPAVGFAEVNWAARGKRERLKSHFRPEEHRIDIRADDLTGMPAGQQGTFRIQYSLTLIELGKLDHATALSFSSLILKKSFPTEGSSNTCSGPVGARSMKGRS